MVGAYVLSLSCVSDVTILRIMTYSAKSKQIKSLLHYLWWRSNFRTLDWHCEQVDIQRL